MTSNSFEVERIQGPPPTPAELRKELEQEGLNYYRWSNEPGYQYGAHQHSYQKVILVEQGSITFHLTDPNRSIELKAGDRMRLPAGTVHAATVGASGVACLEAHIQ